MFGESLVFVDRYVQGVVTAFGNSQCSDQHVFCWIPFVLACIVNHIWWSYLVSCTELIRQSLVDDSKLGEAVRPYVERKMMGKRVHKYNNIKKNLFGSQWLNRLTAINSDWFP